MANKPGRQQGVKSKRGKLSGQRFSQADDVRVVDQRRISPEDDGVRNGPQLNEVDTPVPIEGHYAGTVNVRAKLTKNQRRNLRITRKFVTDWH